MRGEGIIFPMVKIEDWCQRYGLELAEHPCPGCGKSVTPSVPFAVKGYRGAQTAYHGCDTNGAPYSMVPVGENAKEWDRVMRGIFGEKK